MQAKRGSKKEAENRSNRKAALSTARHTHPIAEFALQMISLLDMSFKLVIQLGDGSD